MYKSVFTNYLSPYYESGLLPEVDQSRPSEIYAQLRIAYNQGSVGVLNTTRMIAPFTIDEDDYDIIETVWNTPELQDWLKWVNEKITLEIGVQSYQTLGVRLRIATSMLYKLIDRNVVSVPMGARIHAHLCDNVWNENNLIINADLPFLGRKPNEIGILTAHYDLFLQNLSRISRNPYCLSYYEQNSHLATSV